MFTCASAEGRQDFLWAEACSGCKRHASSSITIASPPVPPLVVRAEVVDSDHHDFLPGGLHLREALRIAGAHGIDQAVQPEVVQVRPDREMAGSVADRDVLEVRV